MLGSYLCISTITITNAWLCRIITLWRTNQITIVVILYLSKVTRQDLLVGRYCWYCYISITSRIYLLLNISTKCINIAGKNWIIWILRYIRISPTGNSRSFTTTCYILATTWIICIARTILRWNPLSSPFLYKIWRLSNNPQYSNSLSKQI